MLDFLAVFLEPILEMLFEPTLTRLLELIGSFMKWI